MEETKEGKGGLAYDEGDSTRIFILVSSGNAERLEETVNKVRSKKKKVKVCMRVDQWEVVSDN